VSTWVFPDFDEVRVGHLFSFRGFFVLHFARLRFESCIHCGLCSLNCLYIIAPSLFSNVYLFLFQMTMATAWLMKI